MQDFEAIWEILDKHLTGTTVETLAHGVSNEILCYDEGMWRLSQRSRFNEKPRYPKQRFSDCGKTLRQTANNSGKTASRVDKPVSMVAIQVESDFKKLVLLASKHPCVPCDRAELYLTCDRQLNKDNYTTR